MNPRAVNPLKFNPPLNLLVYKNLSIFEQLTLEEALLRADQNNWCLINEGTTPAIVMGISGKSEKLIAPEILQNKQIPIIRRFSGGGTVYVDSDTNFVTWIFNSSHLKVDCCPAKIHEWTANFYAKTFSNLNISLRENDFVIDNLKWAGNAQYICKDRWLHHSSILWDFNEKQMECLLMPEKTPNYRNQRKHADFLCRLKNFLPSRQDFHNALIKEIKAGFDVTEIALNDAEKLKNAPHRKATTLLE